MTSIPIRKGQPMAKTAKPAVQPITFLGFLQTNRRGEIPTEADAAMAAILAALREHGGKGKLTLTMNFSLTKSGQIEIKPDLKSEKPRRAMSSGLYFADEDGNLTRTDPNQGDWVDEIATRRDLDS
jgi:hypothetical protein